MDIQELTAQMKHYLCHCGESHPHGLTSQRVWGVCPERIKDGQLNWHNDMGCPACHCAWCGAVAPPGTPSTYVD